MQTFKPTVACGLYGVLRMWVTAWSEQFDIINELFTLVGADTLFTSPAMIIEYPVLAGILHGKADKPTLWPESSRWRKLPCTKLKTGMREYDISQ